MKMFVVILLAVICAVSLLQKAYLVVFFLSREATQAKGNFMKRM